MSSRLRGWWPYIIGLLLLKALALFGGALPLEAFLLLIAASCLAGAYFLWRNNSTHHA